LGLAVFIRENRWSTPRVVRAVVLTEAKWLWGNPPTLV
jgi:hypothetical protein